MSNFQLLLLAGTHGNEINAPWLLKEWKKEPQLINTNDLKITPVIANPAALNTCKRYIDRDLNRSFHKDLFALENFEDYEIHRAIELLDLYGPEGSSPCQVAIDLHSTTSSMGGSLVVYGQRPADLAIASLVQARLGLPIYLHEGDDSQQGFLVESWPCGFVIEIGPVAQGLLDPQIILQTRVIVQILLEEIKKFMSGLAFFPEQLVVHRHLRNLDFPRDRNGEIEAYVHSSLIGEEWRPLKNGAPIFTKFNGDVVRFSGHDFPIPVFINEAAYMEKHIAMSLTKREVWPFSSDWRNALEQFKDI